MLDLTVKPSEPTRPSSQHPRTRIVPYIRASVRWGPVGVFNIWVSVLVGGMGKAEVVRGRIMYGYGPRGVMMKASFAPERTTQRLLLRQVSVFPTVFQ